MFRELICKLLSLFYVFRLDKCIDSAQMVENLKSHVHSLDKDLKIERDKNSILQ